MQKKLPDNPKTFFISVLLQLTLLTSCGFNQQDDNGYQPTYHQDSNTTRTILMCTPSFAYYNASANQLIAFLNKQSPAFQIRFVPTQTYSDYLNLLQSGKFDISLINGIEAMKAKQYGFDLIGKIADDSNYYSVILTRKDADFEKITSLKNTTIAVAGNDSLPATFMGLYFMANNGIDINKDIRRSYLPSFESVILNTLLGKCDAGICLSWAWDAYVRSNPSITSKVVAKWQTASAVHNALIIRSSLDEKTKQQIANLFFTLQEKPGGKQVLEKLGISKFEQAEEKAYLPLTHLFEKFQSVNSLTTKKEN